MTRMSQDKPSSDTSTELSTGIFGFETSYPQAKGCQPFTTHSQYRILR